MNKIFDTALVLYKQLIERKRQYIFKNIIWLFSEKVFRMLISLVVSVFLARYLGPSLFGVYNYIIAYCFVFFVFASFGLDFILMRELSDKPEKKNILIGTAFGAKLIISTTVYLLCIIFGFYFFKNGQQYPLVLFLIASQIVFQPFYVFRTYFNSIVKSKFAVYSKNTSVFLVSIYKIFVVINGGSLELLAIATFLEYLIEAAFLSYFYLSHGNSLKLLRFSLPLSLNLLKKSLPLVVAAFFHEIYMRMDQIMLGELSTNKEVGFYSIANRLTEAWYFIPAAVMNSYFSTLVNLKKANPALYLKKLQFILNVLFKCSIAICVITFFTADYIILAIYGDVYIPSVNILKLQILSLIFLYLGSVAYNWYIIEGLEKLAFYRTSAGALLNGVLNFLFIPLGGAIGASLSTIIATAVSSYIANSFFHKTRKIFCLQSKAIYNLFKMNLKE